MRKKQTTAVAGKNPVLEELMTASFDDPSAEPAFFKALLEATVYVHKAANDPSPGMRLVQFPHPETGALLLPFFIDLHQAQIASSPRVQIVKMTGRKLLEATLGATLILNPNSRYCLIYPEEARLLLAGAAIPQIHRLKKNEEGGLELEHAVGEYGWLIDPLRDTYSQIAGVVSAALGQRAGAETGKPPDLVIVVVVSAADEERVAHATTVVLKDACAGYGATVDIGTVRSGEVNPWGWLPKFYNKSSDMNEAMSQSIH